MREKVKVLWVGRFFIRFGGGNIDGFGGAVSNTNQFIFSPQLILPDPIHTCNVHAQWYVHEEHSFRF